MSGKLVPMPHRRRARGEGDDAAALVARRAVERWLSDAFRHRADAIAGQIEASLPKEARAFLRDFSREHSAPGTPAP
jgi:hypothetical protein